MSKGTRVWVGDSAASTIADASANRCVERLATVLGPWNPRYEHDYWRVQMPGGQVVVVSGSMITLA